MIVGVAIGCIIYMYMYSFPQDIVVRQLVSQVRSMEEHISLLQSELATLTHSPTPYTEAKSLGETSPPQYHIR